MADQSADKTGGLALRARLITIPFGDMPAILYGKKRVANLPESSYIRTFQVNLQAQVIELMVIDGGFAPVINLGDMPTVPAEVILIDQPPKRGRRR